MDRLEETIQAARVLAAQEARAYKVFEVRGTDEAAQAFVLTRVSAGGCYCVLAENKVEDGQAKVREVIGIDTLEFIERFRATPPQWN